MSWIVARRVAAAAVCVSLSANVIASELDEPILRGGQLIFPDGAAIPRSMTEAERRYVRTNPLTALREATDPPTWPVVTPPEYGPIEAVMFSYQGSGDWKGVLDQMAYHITHTGNADVYVYVPNQSGAQEVQQWMIGQAGADPDRVHIIIHPTNTIWIRDFGPRYIYEGNVRAIVDHTYNRPRPLDNAVPAHFSSYKGHAYYKMPIVHGGGNYHLDGTNAGYTTRLIVNENPGLSEAKIYQLFRDYQSLTTFFFNPFPTSVDSTQHVDMWMIPVADDKVIISDWSANPGSTQAIICDMAAADFANRGYTVYRTPARRVGGVHYNFANAVIVNDLVIIPGFTNSTVAPLNSQAKAVWEQALPNHTVVQVNAQSIVSAAGIFHCIMMHIPPAPGGENPTVLLRTLRGGEELEPGEKFEIRWSSDDDKGVEYATLHVSVDGGNTFKVIAEKVIGNRFSWPVPNIATTKARLRVTVRDADGNVGYDESDSNFSIKGAKPVMPGDLNGDGSVDVSDLMLLMANWGACTGCPADMNDDGKVDLNDLMLLMANWG